MRAGMKSALKGVSFGDKLNLKKVDPSGVKYYERECLGVHENTWPACE